MRNSECVDTAESAIPRRTGHLGGLVADAIAPEQHPTWLGRRGFRIAYAAFAAYAAVAALTTAGQDRVWALWALPGYVAAALLLWHRRGPVRAPALLVAVALALVVPLTWLSVKGPLTAGMIVVGRSAELLIGHGLPYLPPDQLSSWLSYNPYLPLMALFGMPKAAGLAGLAGDPSVWMALATVALLAVVIWAVMPHPVARCRECRRDVLVYPALAVSSPLIALNLAVITTDPPAARRTGGNPPPGRQPRRHLHRRPERPLRLLHLPARAPRLAGADQLSARRRRDGRRCRRSPWCRSSAPRLHGRGCPRSR